MTDFNGLIDGYHRFRDGGWQEQRERWAQLSQGQSPKVMVIACSDSRVDPAQIFDVSPGEIFVVRNVANLVPPFENDSGRHGVSAALEFAVTQLEVPEVVVMGHGSCGGCAAALSQRFAGAQPGEGGFIGHWVEHARRRTGADRRQARHGSGGGTRDGAGDGARQPRQPAHLPVRGAARGRRDAAAARRLFRDFGRRAAHAMDEAGDFAPA